MSNRKNQEIKFSESGLPLEVRCCKKCVESNQRFIGSVPHSDRKLSRKDTIVFDTEGVCSACRYFESKKNIDWEERERKLKVLLDRYRRKDGYYDVVVPGSGGKDSCYTSHILKYKYGMNPLTVTWAPHMYTDIGWKNFQSWIHSGFDNVLFTPNGKVHQILTRLAFENLLHPFQPFVIGQYNLAPKIAIEKKIPLIIYGDYYPEKGVGKEVDFANNEMDQSLYSKKDTKDIFFGGVPLEELPKYGIELKDLNPYLPVDHDLVREAQLNVQYLPYYLNYDPQRAFYYAVEHTGFEVNPDGRTEGTYTKYQSLDDKVDGFHYFTWFIKTGRGRATEDAALEVRNEHITREEAVALVKRFDGEFPKKYFKDFLQYIDITEERFWKIIDAFRPSHLWEKVNGEWKLKQQVS